MKKEEYFNKRIIHKQHGSGRVIGIPRNHDSVLVQFDGLIKGGHNGYDEIALLGTCIGQDGYCWYCNLGQLKLQPEYSIY